MKIFEGSDYDVGDSLRRVGVSDADIAAITRNARHLDAYLEDKVVLRDVHEEEVEELKDRIRYLEELLERKESEDDC